jgi:hypothetical protein
MIKTFLPILLVLGLTGYWAYPDVAPKFNTVPARVYEVTLSATVSLGSVNGITSNITLLNQATLSTVAAQALHTQPQSLTFLRITSSQGTVYASVNWNPNQGGEQIITFSRIVVPITDPNSQATFYYHDYNGAETPLGTH